MDYNSNGRRVSSLQMRPESQFKFAEGIYLLLSRWNALQMAIKNEWGGGDSRQKSEQLAADLFSWLSQSKVTITTEDLEHMLDERMILSFNTEIEDGSIEEVAEALMIMHEECLQGNYESVEKLRIPNYRAEVVSQHRQVVKEYDNINLASIMRHRSVVVVDIGLHPKTNDMSSPKQIRNEMLKPQCI